MIKSVRYAFCQTAYRASWGLGAIVLYLAIVTLPPASYWFDVRAVYVTDAMAGQAPLMRVDSFIHRPFEGMYRVELERKVLDGYVSEPDRFRPAIGSVSYNPDAALPEPLTLDWWAFPETWRPPSGVYRIETCWTINPDWWWPRRTCRHSNDFMWG